VLLDFTAFFALLAEPFQMSQAREGEEEVGEVHGGVMFGNRENAETRS
jgi:hypothetical protein